MNQTMNKKAATPAWVSPLLGTGLGALFGLGFNNYVLKNKSVLSNVLAAMTGGGSGLLAERILNGASADDKPAKGTVAAPTVSNIFSKYGLKDNDDNRRDAVSMADIKNNPWRHAITPLEGLTTGASIRGTYRWAKDMARGAIIHGHDPAEAAAAQTMRAFDKQHDLWRLLFDWRKNYRGLTASGRLSKNLTRMPLSVRLRGLTPSLAGLGVGIGLEAMSAHRLKQRFNELTAGLDPKAKDEFMRELSNTIKQSAE